MPPTLIAPLRRADAPAGTVIAPPASKTLSMFVITHAAEPPVYQDNNLVWGNNGSPQILITFVEIVLVAGTPGPTLNLTFKRTALGLQSNAGVGSGAQTGGITLTAALWGNGQSIHPFTLQPIDVVCSDTATPRTDAYPIDLDCYGAVTNLVVLQPTIWASPCPTGG